MSIQSGNRRDKVWRASVAGQLQLFYVPILQVPKKELQLGGFSLSKSKDQVNEDNNVELVGFSEKLGESLKFSLLNDKEASVSITLIPELIRKKEYRNLINTFYSPSKTHPNTTFFFREKRFSAFRICGFKEIEKKLYLYFFVHCALDNTCAPLHARLFAIEYNELLRAKPKKITKNFDGTGDFSEPITVLGQELILSVKEKSIESIPNSQGYWLKGEVTETDDTTTLKYNLMFLHNFVLELEPYTTVEHNIYSLFNCKEPLTLHPLSGRFKEIYEFSTEFDFESNKCGISLIYRERPDEDEGLATTFPPENIISSNHFFKYKKVFLLDLNKEDSIEPSDDDFSFTTTLKSHETEQEKEKEPEDCTPSENDLDCCIRLSFLPESESKNIHGFIQGKKESLDVTYKMIRGVPEKVTTADGRKIPRYSLGSDYIHHKSIDGIEIRSLETKDPRPSFDHPYWIQAGRDGACSYHSFPPNANSDAIFDFWDKYYEWMIELNEWQQSPAKLETIIKHSSKTYKYTEKTGTSATGWLGMRESPWSPYQISIFYAPLIGKDSTDNGVCILHLKDDFKKAREEYLAALKNFNDADKEQKPLLKDLLKEKKDALKEEMVVVLNNFASFNLMILAERQQTHLILMKSKPLKKDT